MFQGGFFLRSWQSNSPELRLSISEDNLGNDHGKNWEKLLGYYYYPSSDKISLAKVTDAPSNSSKRGVLSFNARLFDPLGLYTPVTCTGKIIMRELWSEKVSWDQPLTDTLEKRFIDFMHDCVTVSEVKFPRSIVSDSVTSELILFTDASKLLYGICAYVRSIDGSKVDVGLIFSKVKVTPMKSKSLPTLELLAVYLAMRSLSALLTALNSLKIDKIIIATDSQVALTWILDGKVKTGNIFAQNRIKDINYYETKISSKFNVTVKYDYVHTSENPADLLTRGLSSVIFCRRLEFWVKGPEFLIDKDRWPRGILNSVSVDNQKILCNTNSIFPISSEIPISIDRYSSAHRLFNITAYVLLFLDKLKSRIGIISKVKPFMEYYGMSKSLWLVET